MSNEANLHNVECAWLVFGVEDKKHKIVGTNYRLDDKSLNSLKEEIALVDKILEAKKMLNQVQHDSSFVDTTDLEKQIDQKVYELYGLTPEEIAVVEGK